MSVSKGMASGISTGIVQMSVERSSSSSSAMTVAWKSATVRGSSVVVRMAPSVRPITRKWSTMSNSIVKPPRGWWIRDVVKPRAVTYSGTFHQWFTVGVWAIRTLPTIWVHRWKVSRVSTQPETGIAGHVPASGSAGSSSPVMDREPTDCGMPSR